VKYEVNNFAELRKRTEVKSGCYVLKKEPCLITSFKKSNLTHLWQAVMFGTKIILIQPVSCYTNHYSGYVF
jgi:hypothetical protein